MIYKAPTSIKNQGALSAVRAHGAYLNYMLRAHAWMIRASKYLSTVRNFQWL